MQEFTVDAGDWKAFWERWWDTIDRFPGLKEAMLEKIGGRVRGEVREAVDRSGLNGSKGRAKRYQPRARRSRVKGYDFYAKAQAEAEKIAVQEAENFLRRLTVEEMKL